MARLLTLLVLGMGTLSLPQLVVAGLTNLATTTMLEAQSCNPPALDCGGAGSLYPPIAWGEQTTALHDRRNELAVALRIAPWHRGLRMSLAEVEFALGNHREAAHLLPPVQIAPLPDLEADSFDQVFASALLTPGRSESYVIAAYQHAAAGNWEAAIQAFRRALSVGPAYLTSGDHQAYFAALAETHSRQAAQTPDAARPAYLSGKYFARAGQWSRAESWLRRAQTATGWQALTAEEQALDWMWLGLVHEHANDPGSARHSYENAAALAPELREPNMRLLGVLRKLKDQGAASTLASSLATLGPLYRLGQFGPGHTTPDPFARPDGWKLVGYNLDEESLATGGSIELWLWWQGPHGATPNETAWMAVGDFWIEHVSTVNLAPNPGFEWGPSPVETPQGYAVTYHSSTPDGIEMAHGRSGGGVDTVLRITNAGIRGMRSYPIPVEPQGLYLTGAWVRSSEGQATIGRKCFPPNFPADHRNNLFGVPQDPKWEIAHLKADSPPRSWVHVAHIGQPLPDTPATYCQVYVEEQSGSAEFDQLLFVKLPMNNRETGWADDWPIPMMARMDTC